MNKIYSALSILFSITISFSSFSQINYGGSPAFLVNLETLSETSVVMPAIDRDILAQADAVTDQIKEVPWRFGVENEVNFSPSNAGFWTVEGEENIWRLSIKLSKFDIYFIKVCRIWIGKGELYVCLV